jgi:1-pyrroline-5-carboxylate dehydrogenase
MLPDFKNEPLVDFRAPENAVAMKAALAKVQAEKGKHYPLVIGGERIDTQSKIVSINPSFKDEVVGYVAKADKALADQAVAAAAKAFESWRFVPAKERAGYLLRAAAIMRKRKLEFTAWVIEDSGKNWLEADADTAEAIDFMEYYARAILRHEDGMEIVPYPGEDNECVYIPIGVGLIVPPWNFALALITGMTTGAVVAGNTAIMKPSSATAVVAAKLMELFEESGFPPGVINYLPGSGGEVGDYLVAHPKVRFINFTGSKDVGLRINKLAADVSPGQKWIKRAILEMGGKDPIVVDDEADLEAAAAAVISSAFGYQGQKCSACSRLIVVKGVYDALLTKVVEKTKALEMGPGRESIDAVGPVIDEKAYKSILNYIEVGKKEGRLVCGGKPVGNTGYYIEPTIIADLGPKARLAQEEVFGPVLAVIKAEDFDDAIKIANGTEFGLTGSVFSNNRAKLAKARREFHVGMMYINRKCTAALVGSQPFGGFNMSGTDSKTASIEYVLLFMQAKTISERFTY